MIRDDLTVNAADIARLADVGQAAVSNREIRTAGEVLVRFGLDGLLEGTLQPG
jgi:hypothetical protein